MSARPPFPVISLDDATEGERGFRRHEETEPRDRRFHFQLPLPARWRRLGRGGEAPTKSDPVALLARYAPADEPGAEVAVTGRLARRRREAVQVSFEFLGLATQRLGLCAKGGQQRAKILDIGEGMRLAAAAHQVDGFSLHRGAALYGWSWRGQ